MYVHNYNYITTYSLKKNIDIRVDNCVFCVENTYLIRYHWPIGNNTRDSTSILVHKQTVITGTVVPIFVHKHGTTYLILSLFLIGNIHDQRNWNSSIVFHWVQFVPSCCSLSRVYSQCSLKLSLFKLFPRIEFVQCSLELCKNNSINFLTKIYNHLATYIKPN